MEVISEKSDYFDQILVLKSMFGDTVSEEVISAVIENYDGDVNLAADAIMNITVESKDDNADSTANLAPDPNESQASITNETPQRTVTPSTSRHSEQMDTLSSTFAEAFRNSDAVPRTPAGQSKERNISKIHNPYSDNFLWSDELKKVFHYHNQGTRILILLRGVPGSGKSYLARYIVKTTIGPSAENYGYHIFSSDSYFLRDGVYRFNPNYLDEAHRINKIKVHDATNAGVSPIIVDNTNIYIWEMESYVRNGVRNGYVILIVEPNTPWARDAYQLSKKNTHNVSIETIRRKLDTYEKFTPEILMHQFRLSYSPNMKPPVKRNFPPVNAPSPTPGPENPPIAKSSLKKDIPAILFPEFVKSVATETETCPQFFSSKADYGNANSASVGSAYTEVIHHVDNPQSPKNENNTGMEKLAEANNSRMGITETDDEIKLQKIMTAQKKLEVIEKLDREWEDGESWDTATSSTIQATQDLAIALEPKPPRDAEKSNDHWIKPNEICDDWSKISLFLPSWQETDSTAMPEKTISIQTIDTGTSMEIGDLQSSANVILFTTSRDINKMNNNQIKPLKMPKKIMLDKSTSTHEYDFNTELVSDCKNSKHHFRAFRKLFNTVPRHILKDVFDSCRGDVNWAVNIILDSYPDTKINVGKNEDLSESDEEPIEECHCLAAYNIIPNIVPNVYIPPAALAKRSVRSSPATQKKAKREMQLTENLLELKRQIESNVMISDNHYSQHYLNTRRRREGQFGDRGTTSASCNDQSNIVQISNVVKPEDNSSAAFPSTSGCNLKVEPTYSDSDSEINESKSNDDELVSINIGHEFQNKLDELFGMGGFSYPENIKPIVNMPMSLLREINAYWQESLAFQMDENAKRSEVMIKQDEEFARQLIAKEEEMHRVGQKPDMPSLKEIMDMELAYSIYEKNISEWRNNEPQDLASRLSREKLYNLFPEISHDILSELLMAHEYNFKGTVESLLVSTGQPELLEDENGIENFVMRKEMERKEKYLQEEKKTMDKLVGPFATEVDKPVTLETVEYYRAEAEKSLHYRDLNFNKAKMYFERNIPSAATFYSDIASLHTKKYEQNSALAAAYLMSYHVNRNPNYDLVDLHFLRVKEALVTMDIFIDRMIVKLREEKLPPKSIYIITGRGQHSDNGSPRIKPAAKRRLQARGISYREINPGLLMGKLNIGHRMTNELPT